MYYNYYLSDLLFLLLGLLICSFFIFWRIFKEKTPHDVNFSWNIYKFMLYLSLFLFYCYILLKGLGVIPESKNKVLVWVKEKLLQKIIEIYEKALREVFYLFAIKLRVKLLGRFLEKFCEVINNMDTIKITNKHAYFYYIIIVIPRLIIGIALFVDIIIINKYYYIYKCFWVILIPFLWRIFYFLINEYYEHGWAVITNYYNIELTKTRQSEIRTYTEMVMTKKEKKDIKRSYTDNINKTAELGEENFKQFREEALLFLKIKNYFLDVFGPNGMIVTAPYYIRFKRIMVILYITIWGYMVLKIGMNEIINSLM